MGVTIQQFAEYVQRNGTEDNPGIPAWLPPLKTVAEAMVSDYTKDGNVPQSILDWAVLTVGQRLVELKESNDGGLVIGSDGQIVRVSRDPMNAVKSTLDAFRPMQGFF